ncbi:GDSL esterase/lipase [Dorcoceras hygrometricum]|uniref:GDSL esterase/lipase n=1 Tax=Dorcoceras hygrometricum TaxID=472368 RepID=A0A2Z7AQV3_9LAMI|nr:GDSL esterase/lipase [Dorcoceras hygrometricum]
MASMYILLSLSLAFSIAPTPPFKKIYAFGDSYTDTGTLNPPLAQLLSTMSSPPYGITFFHYLTNRCSDGRIVIDFIAEALSLPFIPP